MNSPPIEQLIQRDLDIARSERNEECERCALICENHSIEYQKEGKLVIAQILKNIADEIRGI